MTGLIDPHQPEPHADGHDTDPAAALVVEVVRILHANGAESDRVEDRARQAAAGIGASARVALGWSTSVVEVERDGHTEVVQRFAAAPAGLALDRVAAVDTVLDELSHRQVDDGDALERVRAAATLPVANLGLFIAACALGACSLAVILGAAHPGTYAIIAVAAAIGALCRRGLGRLGLNNYWQVGAAAIVAGLGGTISAAFGLGSPLGLAALCPCMILVPGPHILKGALDLGTLRIELGTARLIFATITLIAIGTGVLIGLAVGGSDLEIAPAARLVPIWLDVPAAGVVAVCYGVFYSAPLRFLIWPLLVGMVAHGLRWIAIETWHLPGWFAAGIACLLVGAVLQPVALRRSIPFSVIGFASVVSLMPGVLVFRTIAGAVHLQDVAPGSAGVLLTQTFDDGVGALLTILAATIGFLVPAALWRRTLRRREPDLPGLA